MNLAHIILLALLAFFIHSYNNTSIQEIRKAIHEESEDTLAYTNLLRQELGEIKKDLKSQNIQEAFKSKGCAVCHYKGNNELPKSALKFEYFACYMRGTCRWNSNPNMPIYDKQKIDDEALKELYHVIYE